VRFHHELQEESGIHRHNLAKAAPGPEIALGNLGLVEMLHLCATGMLKDIDFLKETHTTLEVGL